MMRGNGNGAELLGVNGEIESIGSRRPLRRLITLSLKRYGMEISKILKDLRAGRDFSMFGRLRVDAMIRLWVQ
jgi:hypothetical protein